MKDEDGATYSTASLGWDNDDLDDDDDDHHHPLRC